MLRRLLVATAQVKAIITIENLRRKMDQIIYSLYRAKKITKRVYNKILLMQFSKAIIQDQWYNYELCK